MIVRQPRYTKEEAARRGNEIYDRDVRPQMEPQRKARLLPSIWIQARGK